MQLDDWVLCRIYNKKGLIEKEEIVSNNISKDNKMLKSSSIYNNPTKMGSQYDIDEQDQKRDVLFTNNYYNQNPKIHIQSPQVVPAQIINHKNDFVYFDSISDSVPKLHTDSSNCSEYVTSTYCEREVQSEPRSSSSSSSSWTKEFDWQQFNGNNKNMGLFAGSNYYHTTIDQLSPLQDMFMHLQKPF